MKCAWTNCSSCGLKRDRSSRFNLKSGPEESSLGLCGSVEEDAEHRDSSVRRRERRVVDFGNGPIPPFWLSDFDKARDAVADLKRGNWS